MSNPRFKFQIPQKRLVIPPGTPLWVGDPCYVLEPWEEFCNITSYTREANYMQLQREYDTAHERIREVSSPKLWPMIYWSTAYGDGCYPLYRDGREIGSCGVDAGMLSVIPLEALAGVERNKLETLGYIVDAPTGDLHISGGDMTWGELEMYTSGNDPY